MPSNVQLNVRVPAELERFAREEVGAGRFASIDEVMVAGLQLLEAMATPASEADVDLLRTSSSGGLLDGRGTLAVGAVADVTVIDPEMKWTVDVTRFASKSRNSPFGGWELTGRPTHTIVGGEVKWRLDA